MTMALAAGRPQMVHQLTNLRHSHCALQLGSHEHLLTANHLQQVRNLRGHSARRPRQRMAMASAATDSKPEWLREMEADAAEDPDIARVLEGANGDLEVVRERMRQYVAEAPDDMIGDRTGQEAQMQVTLRDVEPFSLWLWMEMYEAPSEGEAEMVEEVLKSWFMVGRLGGFNGMNLQVFNNAAEEGASFLEYDAEECETGLDALFHDMSNTERNGSWLRTWVNMGTADELAIDVLINMLSNFSRENLGIKHLIIGGENEDWKVPEMQLPKGQMDPMQTNMPFDDDQFRQFEDGLFDDDD